MFCTGVNGLITTGPLMSWWAGGTPLPDFFSGFHLTTGHPAHKTQLVAYRLDFEVCFHRFRYDVTCVFDSIGYSFS